MDATIRGELEVYMLREAMPRINRGAAGRSDRKGDGHSSVNHDGCPVAVFMVSWFVFRVGIFWLSRASRR
jgi:hypothetical protein